MHSRRKAIVKVFVTLAFEEGRNGEKKEQKVGRGRMRMEESVRGKGKNGQQSVSAGLKERTLFWSARSS